MRGKLARALRRVIGFDPHKERTYRQINNSTNYYFDSDTGDMKKARGTIFEFEETEKGKVTILTKRTIYKISKKKWGRER